MTYGTTTSMNVAKITISIDRSLLNSIDRLVKSKVFTSRSQALQVAVQEKIARLNKTRLLQESAKLDPIIEQSLADEGLASELNTWPEY
jgi:metal-responsive CopG/Arc/MetJ family transcriptional regulator